MRLGQDHLIAHGLKHFVWEDLTWEYRVAGLRHISAELEYNKSRMPEWSHSDRRGDFRSSRILWNLKQYWVES